MAAAAERMAALRTWLGVKEDSMEHCEDTGADDSN